MQAFTVVAPADLQSDSLEPLLDNFRTIMSSSSGTAFPTTDLQIGMFCFRSNAPTASGGVYQLVATGPANWKLIRDFSKTEVHQEYVDAGLATKQASVTGAATTILAANLTASRVVLSDATGKIVAAPVTATELGYLTGVTSAIQTQFGAIASSLATLTSYPLLDGTRQFTGWVSVRGTGPYTAYRDTDNDVVWLGGTDADSFKVHRSPGVDGGAFVQQFSVEAAGTIWGRAYGYLHDYFLPRADAPPRPTNSGVGRWFLAMPAGTTSTVPGGGSEIYAVTYFNGGSSIGGVYNGGATFPTPNTGVPILYWRVA